MPKARAGTIHKKSDAAIFTLFSMNGILSTTTPTMTRTHSERQGQSPPREVKALLLLGNGATIQIVSRENAGGAAGRRQEIEYRAHARTDAKEAGAAKHKNTHDHRPPPRWGINE